MVLGGALSGFSSGQSLDHDVRYYAYANLSHNLIFLGSSESRSGGGFGLAFGRNDPKVKLYHRIEGELIWEGYYLSTSTKNTGPEFPYESSHAVGILATARYRWPSHGNFNVFGDLSIGGQWIDHANRDLPLCNNSTLGFGSGIEFRNNEKSAFILGGRFLHQSNAGRKRPNYGQNLCQWYIGISVKK